MQVAAAYGDIGVIGSPSPRLTTPVKGVSDTLTAGDRLLYADTREHEITRTIHITVLPDQQVSVNVAAYGILGGHNAHISAVVDGASYALDETILASVDPGVVDLSVGIRALSRGALIIINQIQYEVQADPPSPLHDSVGDYDASIASLTRVAGLTRRALRFTGEPDAVEVPDLGWRGTDNRGVALWIRDAQDGPVARLSDNFSIEVVSGRVNLRYQGVDYESSTTMVDDSEWHHLTVWIDDAEVFAWLDSLEPESFGLSVDTGEDWNCYLARDGSRYWLGEIDEVVFFDQPPAATELLHMRRLQHPRNGSLYADSLFGNHVFPVVRDGQYPKDPHEGQVVITWDGSTALKEAYIDGAWRGFS